MAHLIRERQQAALAPPPAVQLAGWLLACAVLAGVVALDPWGFAPFGPLKTTLVVVLTLAGAAALAGRRVVLAQVPTIAWLVLAGWMLIATLAAADPLHAWIGTPDRRFGWLAWVVLALGFWCGLALSGVEARVVLRAVALGAGGLGAYALAELGGLAPAAVAFAGGRLGGPYGQPAYLAAAGALMVPVAVGLAVDAGESRLWRWVAGACAALGAFAVLASQTRGAWVGLVVAGALLAPRGWRALGTRGAVGIAAAGAALAALVVMALLTPVADRAASIVADGTAHGRLDEWRTAVTALAASPVVGHAPEGYRIAFTRAVDADYVRDHSRTVIPDRAHNGILDVAVTGGLPAAAAYLVLMGWVIVAAWRVLRSAEPLMVGAASGVVAYAVQQQFLFGLLEVDPAFWVVAGIVGATATSRRAWRIRMPNALAAGLAVAAVAVLALGGLEVAADRSLRRAVDASGPVLHTAALAHADRGTALRPDSTRGWFVAARVAARGQAITDVDAALDRIERGLSRSPLDPALRTEHAALLVERAQRSQLPADAEGAMRVLTDLVADDPVHPGHRIRLGTILVLAGDLEGAASQLRLAEDLAPRNVVPPRELAYVLRDLGNIDGARAAAGRARLIDPGDQRLIHLLDELDQP